MGEGKQWDRLEWMGFEWVKYRLWDGHRNPYTVVHGAEINLTSDRSMKEDIKNIENALDKVKKIPAVTFRYKGQNDTRQGWIAQDVIAGGLPEVVTKMVSPDNKEMLAMNAEAMVPYLWQAVKELAARLEKFEKPS